MNDHTWPTNTAQFQAVAKENEKLREIRFQRLEFLLKKSSMYTSYLLSRIKEQEKEEYARQERKRKRMLKRQEKARQERLLKVCHFESRNRICRFNII